MRLKAVLVLASSLAVGLTRSVMPGEVFISRNQNEPSARSITSALPQPRQPSTRKLLSAVSRIASPTSARTPAGQWYFVASVKYLFW